jgi:hypothetical protein
VNNFIMRKHDVQAALSPLSDRSLVASVTISCPPGNAEAVIFLGDDGSEVPWVPGEWHTLRSIDLSEIRVKGQVGDTVTVVGGTW